MLWLNRFIVGFSVAGVVLGVTTLGIVHWVMSKIRADAWEQATASGDAERLAAFHEAVRVEQTFWLGILTLIMLVAATNIMIGLLLRRRDRSAQ
jgi:ABC-type lipoprotein release transport system permease subunit